MKPKTKRKLIKAIDIAVQALELKCGGPGSGVPGPCPGPRKPKPPKENKPKEDKPKPATKPPKENKPKEDKPKPATKPPKENKPTEKPKSSLDGKPKPKISPKDMADAGISIEKGRLKISKPKTPEQAISQLKIVAQIHTKAMSMAEVASKLPKGDPQKQKILLAAASVDRAFKRTVSQSKKLVSQAKPAETNAKTPAGFKGGTSNGQKFDLKKTTLETNQSDKKWLNSLAGQEKAALKKYTDSVVASGDIRKQSAKPPLKGDAAAFVAALNKAEKHEGVVFRGISTNDAKSEGFAAKLLAMKPGDTYTEKGVASTSANPMVAVNFSNGGDPASGILFKIRTKTAARMKEASFYKSEEEVVTKPGVKYRVVGVHKDADVDEGNKVKGFIELEEID